MAVQLANRRLGVRRRAAGVRDAHGDRPGGGYGAMVGPWPGRAEERGDVAIGEVGGRAWVLAVDPAAWPVYQQDVVVDPDSRQEWLVTSADLATNNVDPVVDYIRVEAHLRAVGGTRP